MFASLKDPKPKHWGFLAGIIIVVVAWVLPEIMEEVKDNMHFQPPIDRHLTLHHAIMMTGTEFQDVGFQTKTTMLHYDMDYACEVANLDVIFAFNFELNRNNRSMSDHIFMLCNSHKIYSNAIILPSGKEEILCEERYAGTTRVKRRPLNVTVKAIDIKTFNHVTFESESAENSCELQHAVDMLDKKW
jgi:hypothetical protein